jgi:hypothetical protein
MEKNDGIKEKLMLYRTIFTVFWTSCFVLGGGLYTLIPHLKNLFYIIIFSFGCIFEIILFSVAIGLIFRCKRLIKQLTEM